NIQHQILLTYFLFIARCFILIYSMDSKPNPLEELQYEFDKGEKAAIIGAMVNLAAIDGSINSFEEQCIAEVGQILRIEFNDPIHKEMAQGGLKNIIAQLGSLNKT